MNLIWKVLFFRMKLDSMFFYTHSFLSSGFDIGWVTRQQLYHSPLPQKRQNLNMTEDFEPDW